MLRAELQISHEALAHGRQASASATPACTTANGLGLGFTHPAPAPCGGARSGFNRTRRCTSWANGTSCSGLHPCNAHAQRRIGYFEHILALVGDQSHIGRHAGQQAVARVGEANHGGIGHYVGNVLCSLAHLTYFTLKSLAGIGVNSEAGFLSGANAAHITFVNAGVHLHVLQVLGNHKQLGGLQTGRHGLAFFDGALDHNTVDRRGDARALQINAGLRQGGFALRHIGLRRFDLRAAYPHLGLRHLDVFTRSGHQGAGTVHLGLRNKTLGLQAQVALVSTLAFGEVALRTRHRRPAGSCIGLGRQHCCAGRVDIGLRLAHTVFERFGVNLRNELPRLDFAVEVHKQLLDLPRHLGAD